MLTKKVIKKSNKKKHETSGNATQKPMEVLMKALREVEQENADKIMKILKSKELSYGYLHQEIAKDIMKKTHGKFDPAFIQTVVEIQYPHNL